LKIRKTSLVLLGAALGTALTLVATQPVLVGSAADAKTVAKTDVYRLLNMFGDAFEQVRSHYVERPNDAALVQTAVNGMLADLEDSYYIDPQALARTEAACTGPRCATGNVGVAYTMQDSVAVVVTPIDDTPAAKADIMTGDIIARVDDEQVQGLTYQQFGTKLVGDVGSTVKLTLVRPGRDKPIELAIVRDNPTRRSVRARGEGGDIGYIRIIQFNETTGDQLKKAIDDISAQIPADKLKGYVIDLRNNPGGTLDGAIAAADGFLDDGEIVSIRHRSSDKVERFRAKAGDLAAGKPIVVLINGGSAAKAELVAGALKDNHRATVVGTRSFGEGWDSTTVPLGPGKGALRLATGHYITPSGRLIQSNGIVPDVEAPQDVPDALKVKAAAKTTGKDQPTLQSYIPPDPSADKALTAAYALLRKTTADARPSPGNVAREHAN
jgi:carboxyl-terminal processing protease